jgi:phage terminase large subunit-like protein
MANQSMQEAVVIAPRGFAKTTLTSRLFPFWHWFVRRFVDDKRSHVVMVSYEQQLAREHLDAIKGFLESDQFRRAFGEWGESTAQMWRGDMVVLKDGSIFRCRGCGQQMRGLNRGGLRPTLIVLDDIEHEKNTKTAEAMQANLNWVLAAVKPSLSVDGGRVFVIGTPLHEMCVVEQLAKAWPTVRYTAVDEYGKSQWPEMYSDEHFAKLRREYEEMGKLPVYYREYLCKFLPEGSRLFEPPYQYYEGSYDPENGILTLLKPDGTEEKLNAVCFIGVDPAFSTSATADFTAIVPVAVTSRKHFYVLPYWHRRAQPGAVMDEVERQWKALRPVRVNLEATAGQEIYRSLLNEKGIPGLQNRFMPRVSKEKRYLEGLQPIFASKRVFLPKGQSSQLEQELLMFPYGKHDDLIDGLYYATLHAFPASERTIGKDGKPKKKTPSRDWMLA